MLLFSSKSKGLIQLFIVIGFIIICFAVSATLQSTRPTPLSNSDQDRPVFVETQFITPASHQITFESTGVVESLTDIDVVPQVSGQVIWVNQNFFEGGEFRKNEILFKIDPRDFENEVERLEAEVARAQTGLDLEQAESQVARSEWKRINDNKAIPDLVARKPQLAEAQAILRSAQAQLKIAQRNLERSIITLPFNGRVLSTLVANGRFVSSGQSVAQVFNSDDLEVRSSLTDQQLKWLTNTENVEITLTATHLGDKQTYQGNLKRSSSILNTTTRFATVSFGFDNANDLLPGIFVDIQIKGKKLDNITLIPTTAIQKDNVIWTVDEDDRLKSIDVNRVYASDTYLAVSDLHSGKRIVTSKLDGGAQGMKVITVDNGGNAP